MPSLPYHEPTIITILSFTSFLLLLNGIRVVLDRLLYCGLLGEILLGVIWGLPVGGTAWLTEATQETVQALGYLGLIGLVFEGGLSTSPSQLRATAYMSVSMATIGLLLPIALSLLLLVFPFSVGDQILHPTPLAAFSAGASLCSTSLGTTFAILSAAGLSKTRVGVVLVGAAMMDDVVGLVMVKIVTALGRGVFTPWGLARRIVSSVALLLVTVVITPWVLRPLARSVVGYLQSQKETSGAEKTKTSALVDGMRSKVCSLQHQGFVVATLALLAFITIAAYIDASILLATFIAGGLVETLWIEEDTSASDGEHHNATSSSASMYETYYRPVVDYVLAPFFFVSFMSFDAWNWRLTDQASIGFAIPIRDMFEAQIVWKGIVYAFLMLLGKVAVSFAIYANHLFLIYRTQKSRDNSSSSAIEATVPRYPALIISLAMVARGEIGFLIASLSSSSGTLTLKPLPTDSGNNLSTGQEVFLVIIWAVVLCTLIGPIGVGLTVRKLRRLEDRQSGTSRSEVQRKTLGLWPSKASKLLCLVRGW